MHILNESAAALYKTCTLTLIRILVRIICDIYVFGLRM